MKKTSPRWLPVLAVAALALIASGCGSSSDGDTSSETTTTASSTGGGFEGDLVGTFAIATAKCADGEPTAGSYFRMLQAGGTPEDGPYVPNGDSACGDQSYSGLVPGSDGGLITGVHQPAPDPAFDADGGALAGDIFEPVTFFAVAFGGATSADEAVPSIEASEGTLSGDLSAFTAYYSGADFNQGAPKPDGTGDGPTGTIDRETGDFTIEWTSLIVGGSFDGFTGVWHLEGTFTPTA